MDTIDILGVGIAVLPRPLGDALVDVERLDLGEDPRGRDTWVGYHRDTWVGYHRDPKRLARLRALLDLVIERLAN